MRELLDLILLTTIWVLGITIVTQKGMVAYALRIWGEKQREVGQIWVEPVFVCHWCMPSIHSVFGFLFALGMGLIPNTFKWRYVFEYPVVVMGASLLCGLVWGSYKLIEKQTDYYTNTEKLAYMDIKDRKARYNARPTDSSNQVRSKHQILKQR